MCKEGWQAVMKSRQATKWWRANP